MVATPPAADGTASDYVQVDWGPSFALQHGTNFPGRLDPGLFVSLGQLGLGYILQAGGTGYFRLGAVQPHIESGRLELVKGAPEFPYPAHAVYAEGGDAGLIETAITGLRQVAHAAEGVEPRGYEPGPKKRPRMSHGEPRAKSRSGRTAECDD
jgi:hypothetical protein